MPTLPNGWIGFEIRERLPSDTLTGSLHQQWVPVTICHLGEVSAGGDSVSTPHHARGPKTYSMAAVTRMDIGAWRTMGACQECHRVYAQLPA
jgi:hypothetical protein